MTATKLAVIGAGPGGYTAAFHAADLGLDVTLIDTAKNPGGVCLYRGCIPMKAMLHTAKLVRDAEQGKDMGIDFGKTEIDFPKVMGWKDNVVEKLTSGLGFLTKKRKIEYIQGKAGFGDSNTLSIKQVNGNTEKLAFDKIILATGAQPVYLPNMNKDMPGLMSSDDAMELRELPENMLVIGGGYIGLELGAFYSAMGVKVTVVEMTDGLMPGTDRDLVDILTKQLSRQFEKIMLKTKVAEIQQAGDGIKAIFEGEGAEKKEGHFDKVLVAVGRKPNLENIGLENTGIELTQRGFVKVDQQRRTNDQNIFAIGDITGGLLLAHKASHEGLIAAEVLAGKNSVYEPRTVPFVEYTEPELASAGISEPEAKEKGLNVKVLSYPWAASGRALTLDASEGLTKMIIDADTNRVIGVGIIGTLAGEIISEGVLAIEMAAVASDISRTIHPHPSLSETIMEAAHAAESGRSINWFKK